VRQEGGPASLGEILGDRRPPYRLVTFGRQHGRSERLIMDSGLAFTFIQPNFFMQNLLWSADAIKGRGAGPSGRRLRWSS
jgi:uncharacterized protein YbjT (DUF2867 family)